MSFMRGHAYRKKRQSLVRGHVPVSRMAAFQSPQAKLTAQRLAARYRPSPSASNGGQGTGNGIGIVAKTGSGSHRIKIGRATLDAIENEAMELDYPMTLYTFTDHLIRSTCVMNLHAHPTDEDLGDELGVSVAMPGLVSSMERLSVDPEQRQKDLKKALGVLQSSLGSITRKVHDWEEAKGQLATVLTLPTENGNDGDAKENGNGLIQANLSETAAILVATPNTSFKRMSLGRPRSAKKRKAKSSYQSNLSLSGYLNLLRKSDKKMNWSSFKSRLSFSQLRHAKIPEQIPVKLYSKAEEEEKTLETLSEKVDDEVQVELSVTGQISKLLDDRTKEVERIARQNETEENKRIEEAIRKREEEEKLAEESRKAASNLLRPLTGEEQESVHEALYGHGPESEKLASTETDSVIRKSMRTLRPGQWLNDEVIHYFYSMLAKRDEALTAANPGRRRSHFFKSFFFTKLFDEGATNTYRYKNVKRWSKKVPGKDIFELDKIFVPCNMNQMHWTCAVVFVQEKRIQVFDSMNGPGYHYSEGLLRYLQDEWVDKKKGGEMPDIDQWKIIGAEEGVPQQMNGYDCGVFSSMFADFLSLDRPLSFNQTHIDQCRERIALSILKGVAIE